MADALFPSDLPDSPDEFTPVAPGSPELERLHRVFHGQGTPTRRPPFPAGSWALRLRTANGCASLLFLGFSAMMLHTLITGELSTKSGEPIKHHFSDLFGGPNMGGAWLFYPICSFLSLVSVAMFVAVTFRREWLVFEPDRLGRYSECLFVRSHEEVERADVAAAERHKTRSRKNRVRWQLAARLHNGRPVALAGGLHEETVAWLGKYVASWAGVEYRDVSDDGCHESTEEWRQAEDGEAERKLQALGARALKEPVPERPRTFEYIPPGEKTRALLDPEIRPGGLNRAPHPDTYGYRIRPHGAGCLTALALFGLLLLLAAWWCFPVWPWTWWGLTLRLIGYFVCALLGAIILFEVLIQEPLDLERQWIFFSPERLYWKKYAFGNKAMTEVARASLAAVEVYVKEKAVAKDVTTTRHHLRFLLHDEPPMEWPLSFAGAVDARWLADEVAAWADVPLRVVESEPEERERGAENK